MAGEEESPAIGIDLGTTYSCVAVWQRDRVEIITNEQGNRMTPSYVAFTDNERLVGDAAKNHVARNSTNSIFGTLLLHTFYSVFFFFGNRCNIYVDELKKQIENMTSNIKGYMSPTLINILRIHVVVSFSTAFNPST